MLYFLQQNLWKFEVGKQRGKPTSGLECNIKIDLTEMYYVTFELNWTASRQGLMEDVYDDGYWHSGCIARNFLSSWIAINCGWNTCYKLVPIVCMTLTFCLCVFHPVFSCDLQAIRRSSIQGAELQKFSAKTRGAFLLFFHNYLRRIPCNNPRPIFIIFFQFHCSWLSFKLFSTAETVSLNNLQSKHRLLLLVLGAEYLRFLI